VLTMSLILSAVMLLVANGLARWSPHRVVTVATSAAGLVILPMMLTCFFPAVALQAVLLLVVVAVWALARWRFRYFLILSCAATTVAYLVVGWLAYREHSQLREEFAFVSMEERLPTRKAASNRVMQPLPKATRDRLYVLEFAVEGDVEGTWGALHRVEQLRELHEETVQAFIASPGFGVSRMPSNSRVMLNYGLRDNPPVPQPVTRSTSQWSAAATLKPETVTKLETATEFFQMHQSGLLDFLNPNGFGFIKDRRHVAGFQSHQSSRLPPAPTVWVLQTLDLIGLAMHDEPVAYISAHLPKMEELRTAPTRRLDALEQAGLHALRKGDDVFVADTMDGRRVLGALRSVRQCLSCHDSERGDLLGAFSYTLVRSLDAR
jgi:hypothetical protein